MKTLDKLLKLTISPNIAEDLDDDTKKQIAEDVIIGYKIDEDSRAIWLDTNQEAMRIIKHAENDSVDERKDFPFKNAAKVIYPLLAPAVIQMAARLSTHIVQNDKVCTYAVLGPDPDGQKGLKATRLTDYTSAEFLINSDTWLKDTHKLCSILSSWGVAFRQVYYDPISKKPCHELIPPEDVIINHNLSSLEKARRITVKTYLTKNDIVSLVNSGKFLDIEDFDKSEMDIDPNVDDSREINPTYTFLCQTLYLDLDDDGYAEPYKAYVHEKSSTLFGLYPAFKIKDIEFDNKNGKILKIKPRIDIVDFHCIDDPEGKFYSIGLNYLLVHPNKSITSILRQLIDSGTLNNTQGGFITKAFKTQEKRLKFEMGEFKVLECDYTVDPTKQIIPLPFKEPSQVLLALLQTLIQSSEKTGFISDVLTGDVESQNTPATTMLAMVEQGTRAFKPVVQKLYISLKKEFKMWFDLNSEYLDVNDEGIKYAAFQGQSIEISKADFDSKVLDVCPVVDPTMSSEAHKYAKLKVLTDLFQNTQLLGAINVQAALMRLFEGLQFENPQELIAPPQPPQPDPNMMKLQLQAQKMQMDDRNKQQELEIKVLKAELDRLQKSIKANEFELKVQDHVVKRQQLHANAEKDMNDIIVQNRLAKVAEDKVDVEREKLRIMEKQRRDANNSNGNN